MTTTIELKFDLSFTITLIIIDQSRFPHNNIAKELVTLLFEKFFSISKFAISVTMIRWGYETWLYFWCLLKKTSKKTLKFVREK